MNKEFDSTAHHDDLDHDDDFSELEELCNCDDTLDDDVDELTQQIGFGEDDVNYNLGYQVGYDSGYIEGYDQGQQSLLLERESDVYNQALTDIIQHIDRFEFAEKSNVLQVIQLLRRI